MPAVIYFILAFVFGWWRTTIALREHRLPWEVLGLVAILLILGMIMGYAGY